MPRTKPTALAAALLLTVSVAACGGSKESSPADVKAKVATEIAKSGLGKKASECFADVVVDEIGAKKLTDVDFSASAPPKGLEDEFATAATKALSTCDIDVAELNG